MSKTLNTIQTISKVLKVIAMIAFVLSIIGAIFCALAIALLFAVKDIVLEDITVTSILNEAGISFAECILSIIISIISCIGSAVLAKFAHTYFANELEAGTPFTHNGAKELKRLGIMWIAFPLGISLTSSIAFAIYKMFDASSTAFSDYSVSVDISIGIILIIISIIFEYGADREESKENEFFNL